jgi:predicted metalloprotease with PDZ domain
MKSLLGLMLLLLTGNLYAEDSVRYELRYEADSPGRLSVHLQLPRPTAAPLALVMPRTYPGGYAQLPYDEFVTKVVPRNPEGVSVTAEKDADAPRWQLGQRGDFIASVDYQVDVVQMERTLHDAVASSKARMGYVALLGYSVLAYLEGYESAPAHLQVSAPAQWPILLTLAPRLPMPAGSAGAEAGDYYELADSQILMGPDLRVSRSEGRMPLVMAIYAEGEVDAALEGRLAREALDRVQAYFGDKPIAQYTVQLEFLKPLVGHGYGFSQEHLASGTFSLALDAALRAESTAAERDRTRFNFAHHMAHSWIPKRAYGAGYRPFTWEMTPVMDTIWFNEGFGRYAAIAAIAAGMPATDGAAFRRAQLSTLEVVVDGAPLFIRRMPLEVLSREASFLYSTDFRTGRNVFARGALMAAQMDDRIIARTHGGKSLRDALRWLLNWSAVNQRPFRSEDLPKYFQTATGVDVADIYYHWMQPLETQR